MRSCTVTFPGYGGPMPPSGWGDHEPSHCRHGMWLHGCGVFRVNTKPEFSELIALDRSGAVRIRTGGGRGEDLLGADLPHPLRSHGPGRSRAFGNLCARGASARNRVDTLAGGLGFLLAEADTKPGSRGASRDTGYPRQEEDQKATGGGIGCRAGEQAGRIGLGRAAAYGRRRTRAILQRSGSVRHELSVAGRPVRQAIASGADESSRGRFYHLVLIRQNS